MGNSSASENLQSMPPSAEDARANNQTYLYFGALTLLIGLSIPSGYLIDIQTSYMLKNQLHATATQISFFRVISGLPLYFGFAFGMMRDLWNPFGLRDRGFFLLFAPATAAAFFWMTRSHLTWRGMLIGMLLAMIFSQFLSASFQGLIALVAQEKLMSGRLSVIWNVVSSLPSVAGAFASGYISDHLHPSAAFFLVGALTCFIGVVGMWKPSSVYSHAYDNPLARRTHFMGNLHRLVKHRAIYPAVLLMFLWSFAPGTQTPLQFYLTSKLHASDAVYSYYNGIFAVSFIPTFLLYGYLCRKVSLEKLLWWGTVIAVPQMIPLVFIHSANLAMALAAPMGMMGGIITAAIYDLSMRSCPPGLQGTLMMMVGGVLWLSMRGSDLLGSRIYNSSPEHGFLYCVIATTLVYALMLPVILLVPKELIATADGVENPCIAAAVLKEIAESDPTGESKMARVQNV